jgi:hypothetical protein
VDAVTVEMQLLLIDRNENLLRAFRNLDGRFLAGAIGGFRLVRFMRGLVLMPAAIPAAVPGSGRRRRCTRRQRETRGDSDRAKGLPDDPAIPPRRRLVVSRVQDKQFCPRPTWNRLEPSCRF